MRLAIVMDFDPQWTKEEVSKLFSESPDIPGEFVEVLEVLEVEASKCSCPPASIPGQLHELDCPREKVQGHDSQTTGKYEKNGRVSFHLP
jgi:hypothetical protein